MRPPLAIARRVRITFLVRELVMFTMRGHPQERATFQGRGAANREKVLKPLRCGEGAMGEEPVIAYAESQAARHPVKKDRDEKHMPGEEEGCRQCAKVKQRQNRRDRPAEPILAWLIVLQTIEPQDGCRGHSFHTYFRRPRERKLF